MQVDINRQSSAESSDSSGGFCVGFSLALIFLVLGAGLSFWGWGIYNDAKASTWWPTAQGVVVSSSVSTRHDNDGDSYSPEVTYTYLANKQSFKNSTIKFGENSYSNRGQAYEIAERYPAGRKVKVSYDPKYPDKAVLEPGVSGGSFIVLGVGALFVVIGVIAAGASFFFKSSKVL